MIECYLDRAMMSEHKVLQLSISRLSHFATTFSSGYTYVNINIYIYLYLHILGEHRPASYATTARDNGDQAESASTEYFSVEPLCHIFLGVYINIYIYKYIYIYLYIYTYMCV